jgi:hypothetical protein
MIACGVFSLSHSLALIPIYLLVENSYKWQKIVILGHFHQDGIGNMIIEQADSKFIR